MAQDQEIDWHKSRKSDISASGNVGIGTTAPTAPLHVVGQVSAASLNINATVTAVPNGIFGAAANSIGLSTNASERLRIDSNGNVGIGTTSPLNKLVVSNSTNGFEFVPNSVPTGASILQVYDRSGSPGYGIMSLDAQQFLFRPGGLEKMRIDPSGNVGIGTTAPSAKLEVNSGAFGAATGINISTTTAGANTYEQYKANGAVIGSITSAAGVNVAFNTTSDVRLKGGFKPVLSPLRTLNEIEVTNFYYLADPAHQRMDGFKAQQLYSIAPYAVTKPEQDVDEYGKLIPWLADYSKVVPLVTAAVQELYHRVLGHDQQLAMQGREIASKADKTDVEALKARAEKAEQKNARMEADIATMKAQLQELSKTMSTH